MQWTERRPPTYLEFRQEVRQYRPSDLIPALARLSAALDRQSPTNRIRSDSTDMPWVVSAIARDSLIWGNEWRSATIDPPRLDALLRNFDRSSDLPEQPTLAEIVTPLLHEQFLYGESPLEEMCRVYALMDAPGLGPSFDWPSIFGLELREAVRASFVLRAWVAHNDGRFDPTILDLPHFQEVFERIAPRPHIEAVARALTTTQGEARVAAAKAPPLDAARQRYAFNPLVARPLVDLGAAGTWAPQTMLVDRALHPSNLYYRGMEAWGERFARELGERVEAYAGKQLALIAPAGTLTPELEYRVRKEARKSVDWIWQTPRATILIECKSARMTLGARAGDGSITDVVARSLGKARRQLDETARLIRGQVTPFDRFRTDVPIVGVIVTAEPFYLANSRLAEYGKPSSIPSVVMSLRELEYWVTPPAEDAVDALLATLDDEERRTWAFGRAIGIKPGALRNPILEEAWEQYAFIDVAGEAATTNEGAT